MYIEVDLDEFPDKEIAAYVAQRDALFEMVLAEREARKKYALSAEIADVNRQLAEWNELMAMAS